MLLTLVYLRHNVSHAVVGAMFCVSADISERTFHEVVPLLRDCCPAHRWDAEKKWTKKEPTWHPETVDLLLVDSFETPIARPSLPAAQRKFYSGKKKRHTVKTQILTDARGEVIAIETQILTDARGEVIAIETQILTDARGEVIAIETGHPGPQSDKTLYERSQAARPYPRAARRADLGYQGVPEMLLRCSCRTKGSAVRPVRKARC